jgi:hypothetical protein
MRWIRTAAWTLAAVAAAWLRRFAVDEHILGGLTILAVFCAVAGAISVLELASGHHSKRG